MTRCSRRCRTTPDATRAREAARPPRKPGTRLRPVPANPRSSAFTFSRRPRRKAPIRAVAVAAHADRRTRRKRTKPGRVKARIGAELRILSQLDDSQLAPPCVTDRRWRGVPAGGCLPCPPAPGPAPRRRRRPRPRDRRCSRRARARRSRGGQADRTAVGCEMPVAQGPRHDAAGARAWSRTAPRSPRSCTRY